MTRRMFKVSALALALAIGPALAAADTHRLTPEMVNDALVQQGYEVQSTTRTLLGRVRIVASQGLVWREVILDLSTGQILRDYAVEFTPSDTPSRFTDAMPRGGRVLDATPLPEQGD